MNQPRLQRCDQHSQSTPALWFFDPNRSNIWEDVVDLMHSAYTSKVAISGIASLEFRGLAICLVLSFKRWAVIFPIKTRPFCLGIGIFLCVGLRTNPSWKENVAISFAKYLARFGNSLQLRPHSEHTVALPPPLSQLGGKWWVAPSPKQVGSLQDPSDASVDKMMVRWNNF